MGKSKVKKIPKPKNKRNSIVKQIIIAFVINLIIKKTINKIMKANIIKKSKIEERRAKTILMLIRKIVLIFSYLINTFIYFIMIK